MNILVTGCFGFIGNNYLLYLNKHFPNEFNIYGVDSLLTNTSEINYENFKDTKNFNFYKEDINDTESFSNIKIDTIVNFAAESHVDNSITNPNKFIKTNVLGTNQLLQLAYKNNISNFVHISTDEVYGSKKTDYSNEDDILNPSSPYSATKASAEMLCNAFKKTYGMNIKICRPANNYGVYQQPEKLIPYTISNLLNGGNIELYGDGKNVRHWLHVEDTCSAVMKVLNAEENSGIYNIGSGEYFNNLEVAIKILEAMEFDDSRITFVEDRPGHDFRYAVNFEPLKNLGFIPSKTFDEEISHIVNWYKNNENWWKKDYLNVLNNRLERTKLN
jgi:dTDP-glucose 4,6-dehydratase